MQNPLVVTISHQLGKEAAKKRLQDSLGHLREQVAPFVTSLEDRWSGDQLDFRVVALGQTVTGKIEIFEEFVRIEILLPGMLSFFGRVIAGRIRAQGVPLLEKPKD
jgi:hypothetical protein